MIGRANKFEVADKPVWIQVAVCSLLFLLVGTDEGLYLAIYAAGVFVMLSMTAWATSKRLLREWRESVTVKKSLVVVGVIFAALMTTIATFIIFIERLFDGVWIYFFFIPLLFLAFTYFHKKQDELQRSDKKLMIS